MLRYPFMRCVRGSGVSVTTDILYSSFWRNCSTLTNASSDSSVHPDLIEELKELLERVPAEKWIPVGTLYNDLSLDSRRRHVRPHKTLAAALSKATGLGVHLNQTGLMFCKGIPPKEIDVPSRETTDQTSNTTPCSGDKEGAGVCGSSGSGASSEQAAGVFMRPTERVTVDTSSDIPPVDFYYDVGLRDYPPPPPDFDVTASTLPSPTMMGNGAILSLSSFVSYIPPFFVPLGEVLKEMPGYTEEHIERYFQHRASEVVTVAGRKYIRLYGGYAKFPLDGCEVAEERFERYRPDPLVLKPFIDSFGGITGRWMPLRILLDRAGHAAVEKLPFKGPASIIYFAQMQHVFAFAVDRDGGSVLLRPPGYDGLECETTPTPKSCNCILRLVPQDGQVDIRHIEESIPVSVQEEVKIFYGTLLQFFRFHAAVFSLSADGSVVMRRRFKDRIDKDQLSLEEQLAIAISERNKKKIRSLRRRIAFRNDPSNPFHDPDNLARELHRYLPKKGHVPLKTFLKKNVPEELLNYLPRRFWNFFNNYPQYFQHFEYQVAGQWCICQPGLPLPRGVIRQEFSEEDLVRLVAEFLQQRGPKACSTIILHIPRGAQEAVRKRYGGVFYLVQAFPQYFNVVLPAETGNVVSMAMVHLVELPGAEFTGRSGPSNAVVDKEGGKWDENEDIDDEEEDEDGALATSR
ncbi:hypothetical protein C3747_44g53 [Trypanosoma cruzi]|uniref:Uncharacterized protein n=2 Tax=Trypanosoma cruzi TaxID=5693 RepID=Q4DQE5_TRYCC|nr:hypothetical protein, conserved [Trypanosoma cruzi]EAN94761.1 hypothetical protein, conserved [Trypanosoma cruzi]KAF5223997.1 hypothetical protein ECC02_002892 [Trypanosoma cruzi]PWV13259.1 hypothetical protein C3747_44g53 [Trypanosoma cruzi]|eukprot:XP_816612.1 hypothetical protein [Trypanosoma cruzi strain CL Brener]